MNYTPLDVSAVSKKFDKTRKAFDFNAIFLILIVISLLVVAALLFILIQKKLQTLSYVPFFG